ncbi:MAG: hypothetical protein DDT34_01700 [Firmicutes bacterium]|nr:hypothetical protein [Bacillota bacterium]
MFSEDDLLPLSLLAQYYYCARRAGLLMVEQQWLDNVHTAEGTVLHERVHAGRSESRGARVILRGVHLRSLELGISGVADCIELTRSPKGVAIPSLEGTWAVHLVEYKHGKVRLETEYEVQLCAQAMCLEHLWSCAIPMGDIYYGSDRRRKQVSFSLELRGLVVQGCQALHELLRAHSLPMPGKRSKCRECSMREVCLPGHLKQSTVYMSELLQAAQGSEADEEDS